MEKFLKRYKSLKLIKVKINNLNNPVSLKKLNLYINTSQQITLLAQMSSLMNSIRHLRKEHINSTQSPPGMRIGGNTLAFPDTKTRQRL